MENGSGKREIEFTLLDEKHHGYLVEWAVRPSTGSPGKWMGDFHAFKEGEPALRVSIANLYDNPAEARANTIRIAKAQVEEAVAAKG